MKRVNSFHVFGMIVLLISTLIVAYPLVIAVQRSLSVFGLGNYAAVLNKVNIFRNLLNSIVVTGVTLIGTMIICSLAAFAFSKLAFRGRNILFLFLLMGMMIPTSATIFPLFQIIKFLKLVNKPVSQSLPYITGSSIFGLLLLKIYFDSLPNEMMESARIDGASSLRIFSQIMLPNTLPGLSILFVNTFISAWNELLIAITFITKREFLTMAALPVNFASSPGRTDNSIGELFACLIMCLIPIIIFYICAQKMIIRGMTEGTVKG
ncbi:MAG: carbohydrate ABC transporter permease [Treponema sp.]|jgi:raffinose/stachyose/melibiose transport system permease protein|nr:carbohydrate ABC transporter permease [Treponema sp.]